MDAWRAAWRTNAAIATALDPELTKNAIAQLPQQFADRLQTCSDTDLRAEVKIFGARGSRGTMMVSLVLSHYTASACSCSST